MLEKQRKDLETTTQQAEAKQKLAEAKENEAKDATEAKQLSETEAKRKAALSTLATKKAERATRVAQKKAAMDMAPEAIAPKPTPAPAPEAQAQEDVDHSHHDFPDPREGELWDTMRLHQAIWKKAEAIDPDSIDIGNMYIPPAVTAMIKTLYNQLRDLHARDRVETEKILKLKKKASEESDEDFKAEVESTWKKIEDVNFNTK